MIKYIMRKPLIPILLLILMMTVVLFMGLLKRGIERDMKLVEEMYDNAVITYEALPDSAANLELRPHYTDGIEDMEEVDRLFHSMECPYSIRQPSLHEGIGMLYGTNDAVWLVDNRGLTVTWVSGYEPELVPGTTDEYVLKDWTDNDDAIPCIADETILEDFGIGLGDTIVGAPYDNNRGEDKASVPGYNFYVVGTFECEEDTVGRYAMIVPECIFLTEPWLTYSPYLQEHYCAYKQYLIRIKQEYNTLTKEIDDKLDAQFARSGVVIHSDIRTLRKVVRPIEQRLRIQKALERPMEIALSVAVALIALLLGISVQDDIFLFLLFGQSKAKTFGQVMLNLTCIIVVSAAVAAAVSLIVLGPDWIDWILKNAGLNSLLCIATVAVPTLLFCNKNMVNFYQTKEA